MTGRGLCLIKGKPLSLGSGPKLDHTLNLKPTERLTTQFILNVRVVAPELAVWKRDCFSLGGVCLNGLSEKSLPGILDETNSQTLTTTKAMFFQKQFAPEVYLGFYLITWLNVPLCPQARDPRCQTETPRPQ